MTIRIKINIQNGSYLNIMTICIKINIQNVSYPNIMTISIKINIQNGSFIRVFAENLVGLAFLQSGSYTKSNPKPTKNCLLLREKSGPHQTPIITYFFVGWVGLGFCGVRRFYDNNYTFSNQK